MIDALFKLDRGDLVALFILSVCGVTVAYNLGRAFWLIFLGWMCNAPDYPNAYGEAEEADKMPGIVKSINGVEAMAERISQPKRRGGRPKGSKNKPKPKPFERMTREEMGPMCACGSNLNKEFKRGQLTFCAACLDT